MRAANTVAKFGTRYYDPSIGRWTQQDPLAGAVTQPNTLNRYAYANQNPVNVTDPSGYWGIDITTIWPSWIELWQGLKCGTALGGAALLADIAAAAAAAGDLQTAQRAGAAALLAGAYYYEDCL